MLYLLKPKTDWQPWYDKMFSIVVRASSVREARELASKEHGDEGPKVWLNANKTTCTKLDKDGPSLVICKDYARA